MKFYKCKHSGNIVMDIDNKIITAMCSGEVMEELIPDSIDASLEKHIPVVTVNGNNVKAVVGEILHPMIPEHYIMWIAIETTKGSQIKYLQPGNAPEAEFALAEGEQYVAAYAYCNLHGLWISK